MRHHFCRGQPHWHCMINTIFLVNGHKRLVDDIHMSFKVLWAAFCNLVMFFYSKIISLRFSIGICANTMLCHSNSTPHVTIFYESFVDKNWLEKDKRKKYTSGPRYWNVRVLVNTGTFLVYQYCLKMWYLCSQECVGVIQKLTILECKNGLVLSNTRVPVSGTWSLLFPDKTLKGHWTIFWHFHFS